MYRPSVRASDERTDLSEFYREALLSVLEKRRGLK